MTQHPMAALSFPLVSKSQTLLHAPSGKGEA
jgi:hypothetical protein